MAKRQHIATLQINLRDSWEWKKEPIFYTGANVFVLTFYRKRLDWY